MKAPSLVPAARRAARSRLPLVLGIVALLAVTVCGGGSLVAASKLGLVFARAEPTATATLAPTETPEPTETPVPTLTPVPIPMLVNGQLSWTRKTSGPWWSQQCTWTGQQQISNPAGGSALGWRWQAITPSLAFKWWLNSSAQQSSGLPYVQTQAPGATNALHITFTASGSCPSTGPKYTVQMYDTMNRSYTFTTQT